MKQIIVPSDFSKGAWNALIYATDLAEQLGVRDIQVLNSYQSPHSGAATLVSIDRIMQKDSEDGLSKWADKIKDTGLSAKFNFEMKSIHASLEQAVNSQIEDYDSTLVVMGSRGETGAVEKIFGSNASHVALHAHCPVVIIPVDARFTNYSNVVLASDYNPAGDRNLEILRNITFLEPSTGLQVLHVQRDDDDSSSKISSTLDQSDIPHTVTEISGANIGESIDEYVSESGADLLILINKEGGFFDNLFHRSVTKKLTLLIHIPLLVLKGA